MKNILIIACITILVCTVGTTAYAVSEGELDILIVVNNIYDIVTSNQDTVNTINEKQDIYSDEINVLQSEISELKHIICINNTATECQDEEEYSKDLRLDKVAAFVVNNKLVVNGYLKNIGEDVESVTLYKLQYRNLYLSQDGNPGTLHGYLSTYGVNENNVRCGPEIGNTHYGVFSGTNNINGTCDMYTVGENTKVILSGLSFSNEKKAIPTNGTILFKIIIEGSDDGSSLNIEKGSGYRLKIQLAATNDEIIQKSNPIEVAVRIR